MARKTVGDLIRQGKLRDAAEPVELLPDMELELVLVDKLMEWDENPRINDEAAVKLAAEIRRIGFRVPIVATRDGIIRAGHTRIKAAKLLGMKQAPVLWQDFTSKDEAESFAVKDNRMAEEAKWDVVKLRGIMDRWEARHGSVAEVARLTGFTQEEIGGFRGQALEVLGQKDALRAKFIVPPFTVLDARQGYWRNRKAAWLSLGIRSEVGRDEELMLSNQAGLVDIMKQRTWDKSKNSLAERVARAKPGEGHIADPVTGAEGWQTGTSIFDPVLCELVYRWFCPPGGVVLDQFAGGSVRGIVAGCLGLRYYGVDLSGVQVKANREQAEVIGPKWEDLKDEEN